MSVLVVLMLVMWSSTAMVGQFMRSDLEKVVARQQFSMASFIASHIDREIRDHLSALDVVAAQITPAMLADPDGLQRYLDERPILTAMFGGGLVVHDVHGVAMADFPVVKGRRGTNYMNVDSVVTALRDGRSSASRPIIGTRIKVPLLGMSSPIKDDNGNIVGVLSGVINLSKANFLEDIQAVEHRNRGVYRVVAPRSEMYVSASDIKLVMQPIPPPGHDVMHDRYLQGFEGSGIAVNIDGVEELSSGKWLSTTEWFVVAAMPTAEAFAPIDEMRRRLFAVAAFFTMIAGVGVWWWLRRQLVPLEETTGLLREMFEGKAERKPLPVRDGDEIGTLISGFNQLLAVAQAERDRAQKYLDIVGTVIVALDTDGRITMINNAGSKLLGYSVETMLGRNWFEEFIPQRDRRRIRQAFDQLMNGEIGPVEFYENHVITRDGSLRLIYWHNNMIIGRDGRPAGTLSSGEDITERKRTEDALVRSNAELEQFSYAVSHDLQEPLRMVSSYVQLLERRLGDRLDQENRELMGFAMDGARRMSGMISDLLEYSRIQRRGEAFVAVDLRVAVADAMENLKLAIEETQAVVEVAKLPVVMGDRGQLMRLFLNLIGNAIKYRSPDAIPHISIGAEKTEDGWELFVADNGIGIPPDSLDRLFKVFQRLHERDKYPGNGIGLALCKRIVERHGGLIWADSRPGKGSVFRFTLKEKASQAFGQE